MFPLTNQFSSRRFSSPRCAALALVTICLVPGKVFGQAVISLSSGGPSAYTQNFDNLGTATVSGVISPTIGQQTNLGTAVNINLNGWYAAKIAGTSTLAGNITADNGSSSGGGVYNYGATGLANRSLGALSSSGTTPAWGALIRNDTGQPLSSIQLSFLAKFWRSTTNQNILTFAYGLVDGTTVSESNFLTAAAATGLAQANIVYPAGTNNAPLDGNLPANQSAISNVVIPSALSPGQTLFIRWADTNDVGNDAGIAIDDVVLGTPTLGASITATPATISGLTATQGAPGPGTSFNASGANLTGNVTVSATDAVNFAISTNSASGYTNSLVLTNSGGSVASTPVFVRLTAAAQGTFNSTVSLSGGGATTTNVSVGGVVSAPPTPTIVATPSSLSVFSTTAPSPSAAQTFQASGSNLTGAITVTPPGGFELSTNGSTFTSSLTLTPVGGTLSATTVSVRLTGVSAGNFSGDVALSGGGAPTTNVAVSGTVNPPGSPSIAPPNGFSLSGFTTVRPNPSTNQFITLRGSNLAAPITVTPPPGWQISATNTGNYVSTPVVIATNPAGIVSDTAINIRLAGTNSAPTSYTDSQLTLVSGSVSNNVLLSGTVTDSLPTLTVNPTSLSNLVTTQGAPSVSTNFTVSGTGLTTNITITPPAGWQVALGSPVIFTAEPTNIFTNPLGVVSNTDVFVRLAGTNTALTNVTYSNVSLVVASGVVNTNVLLSGQVNAQPALTLVVPTPMPDNTDPVPARVERPSTATNQAVTVTLTANAPTVPGSTVLTVPPTVIIPAGTNSVQFNMKTLQVSGSLAFIVSARASGYRSASTNVLVSNAAARAVSLGPSGYRQTFQSFTNWSSLPYGWTASYAVPTVRLDQNNIPIVEYRPRAITTNEYSRWGTLSNYVKTSYQLDTNYGLVNVFGFQFPNVESTEALLDGDQSLQTLTVRNDLGAAISGVRITYTGRTTRSAADPTNPATKNPIYTVSMAVGTNPPIIDGALSYGTEQGDSIFKSNQISGLNIPAFGTFTIGWNAFQQREVGVAKQIGIGDVTVQALRPFLNVFPQSGIGDFTTFQGTPSGPPQEFWVYGENLFRTNNAGAPLSLVVSMTNTNGVLPVGYQISQDGVNFSNSPVSLPIPTNGIILTNLYVRMSGASPGIIAGTFRVDGGGPQTNGLIEAPVSGTVFSNGPSPQVLYSSTTPLTDFSTIVSVRSPARIIYVSAVNIGANAVTVTAPDGFEVSLNSQNNYGRTALLNTAVGGVLSPTPVYLRLTGDQEGSVSGRLSLTCPGVSPQVVDVGGMVGPEQPLINVSPSLLPIFQASVGETSAPKSFTVGGSYLLTNISIAPPSGFQISTNSTNGFTSNSINLAPVAGTVASTNIFVRFFPTTPGEFSGNVTLSSSNAQTKLVAVAGTVDPVPIIRTTPGQLDGFQGRTGLRTCRQPIQITGQRLRAPGISVTFNSSDWELFTDPTNTTPVGLPYVIPIGSGDTATTTLYVGVSPNAQARPSFVDDWLTFSNGPTVVDVPLSGSVCALSVTVTPSSVSGLEAVQACDNSHWTNFTVSGTNLFGDIVLTNVSPGLEIATNTNAPTNFITLAATFVPPGIVSATDSGANYGSGWTNGANRGQGFLPWSISSGQGTGAAGNFIGNPASAGIAGMATNSFGLYANPTGSSSFVTVQRGLSNNLAVGQTLSFQWGINFDSGTGGNKGFSLFAGASELINVNNAGNSDITLNGTNVGFGYGTNAMVWSFTRTASNTLTITANDRDGSGTYSNTIAVTNGAVSSVRFYASAMQAGDPAQPYFNNLNVATGSVGCGGYAVAPTNIFVRISSNAVVTNPFVGTVTAQSRVFDPTLCLTDTNAFASATVTISGVVSKLAVTPTNLSFYPSQGYASEPQSVRFTGTNILAPVQVGAPTNFEVATNAAGPFTNSLSLTSAGGILNATVYVRVASSAPYGPLNATLSLTPRCGSTEVSLNGRVGRPAENDMFVMAVHRMLLYRDATAAEVATYSALLGGGSSIASNTQKAGVIMRIMGFPSTVTPFPWTTSYDLNNEYVKSASVLFSIYQRLGLVPQPSHNFTLVKPFVQTVRDNPLSPGLSIGTTTLDGLTGAPWTATIALADAIKNFMASGFFASSASAGVLGYTLDPYSVWLRNVFSASAAANGNDLIVTTYAMLQTYGMTTLSTNAFAEGAGLALYSVYAQEGLIPAAGTWAGNPGPWRDWQLQINQASLNYQLWGSWSFSAMLTESNAAALLRVPVLSAAGPLPATVGQGFTYQVARQNSASPINSAPNIYFSATGLPPGLSIDSFGSITGTPTAAGSFTASVTAQNIAGVSTSVSIQFSITGTQAQNWMAAVYGSTITNSLYGLRTNDTDGDGYNTAMEYAFGSNPNVSNNSVHSSSNISANVLRIFWNGLTNQSYTVQASTNLMAGWTNRPGSVISSNGAAFGANGVFYQPWRTDVTNSGAPNEFYRIWTTFTTNQLQ